MFKLLNKKTRIANTSIRLLSNSTNNDNSKTISMTSAKMLNIIDCEASILDVDGIAKVCCDIWYFFF